MAVTLCASDLTVIPYYGAIKYDNAASKSLKDSAQFLGLSGIWNNEAKSKNVEVTYIHTKTDYKSTTSIDSVLEHDLTVKYRVSNDDFRLKVGFHYVYSDEDLSYVDLGTGYVGILGLEGFSSFDKDHLSYGVEAYYSAYLDAHDESTLAYTRMVDVMQFTPYLGYSRIFGDSIRNDLKLKINVIATTQYKDQGYYSYEVEDTFVYRGFYMTLKYLGGEMRSGVMNGGTTLFNNKDLILNYYDCKIGYYITPTLAMDITMGGMNYQEYDPFNLKLLPDGRNSIALLSLSATF